MSEAHRTTTCAHCGKSFEVKTKNWRHAKLCSEDCRKAARKEAVGSGSKVETLCENCGKSIFYWPSQGVRKFCSRACKHEAWSEPSAERGFVDITGQTFGRWTVLSFSHRAGQHLFWNAQCSCIDKTERVVSGHSLKRPAGELGSSQSCGCIAREGEPRPSEKCCNKCGNTFPYDEQHFSKHSPFRWGLRPICLTCWAPIARARHLRWRRKIKLEVLSHYSGGNPRCACCGVDHIEFLTLDHVNDDGKEDRKIRGLGVYFYARLKRAGYPTDPPLVVACFNCNIARGMFGVCPHRCLQ